MIWSNTIWMLLGAVGMVRGLEMCDDLIQTPEIKKLVENPILDARKRIVGVTLTIQLESTDPLKAMWISARSGKNAGYMATKSHEDLVSSEERSGNLFTFKLRDETMAKINPPCQDDDITACLNIYFGLFVNNDCNGFAISARWDDFKSIYAAGSQIPSVVQTPKDHYYINDNAEHELEVVLSPVSDRWENASRTEYTMYCRETTTRIDGKLEYSLLPKKSIFSPTVDKMAKTGNIGRVCRFSMPDNLESAMVAMSVGVENAHHGLQFQISLRSQLRRSNVPGVAVAVISSRVILGEAGTPVLPTSDDRTQFYCIAEASRAPAIAVAKGKDIDNGRFQLLQPGPEFSPRWFYSFRAFDAKSPVGILDEEDYICSAASGDVVTSQKFKLLRFEAVKLESVDPVTIYIDEYLVNDTRVVSCRTKSGNPAPTIRFYGSRDYIYYRHFSMGGPMDIIEGLKEAEITDSEFFDVDVTRANGGAQGKLTIRNMKNVVSSDLNGFDYDQNSYTIYCVAFNKYDMDTQIALYLFL